MRRLRLFREVAEHGGVTAAARAMDYSPSGVSQQMAALEHEVGAPILERRGRGVQLTDVGQVLLEQARSLLDAERRAQAAVETARDTSAATLTVGVFSTVAAGLVPTILTDLAARHQEIQVTTREIDVDEAVLELRHGHLDLAFLVDYPEAPEPWATGLTIIRASLDQLYIAAPTGRFPGHGVDLADLADATWVTSGPRTYYGRAVRAACREAGFELHVAHQVDEQATALAMVRAGMGITLMSDLGRVFMPAGVEALRLRRPLHRQLLIAHDAATGGRPAVVAFLRSALRASRAARSRD